MTSLNRIKASSIHVGKSYVLGDVSPEDNGPTEDEILAPYIEQANEIISTANAQAEKIISDAKIQSGEVLKQSQEEGYKAGFAAGYEDGNNRAYIDMINQINSVELLANASFKVKKEIISSSETEILQLSITIAEKIIKQQLEINPDIMLNIVRAAINELKDKEEVKITVNPVHTKNLYGFSEELTQSVKGLEKVKIVEDKTVPTDGLIVESIESRIDAGLATQISEITRQIMDEASTSPLLEDIPQEIEIKIQEPPDNNME